MEEIFAGTGGDGKEVLRCWWR